MNDVLVRSIGWALVQFLWQGVAISALVGLAIVTFGRTASARYLVATIGLAAMLVTSVTTTIWYARELKTADPSVGSRDAIRLGSASGSPDLKVGPAPVSPDLIVGSATVSPDLIVGSATVSPDLKVGPTTASSGLFREWSRERVEPWLPTAVFIWLAGVLALSLNLLRAWVYVERIRRRATPLVRDGWRARVDALTVRLSLRRSVRVLESALVDVPAVVGWLRPVLLLPASVLTGLTLEQIDAVIAHELAHIRRHDYLVNMFQSVVETLLFFHPAVWWISNRIRVEREHCCDDIAVEVCGDRLVYAEALVGLEELRRVRGTFALAVTDGPLLARVRRLLGTTRSERRSPGWMFGGAALVVIVLLPMLGRTARSAPQVDEMRTSIPLQTASLVSAVEQTPTSSNAPPPIRPQGPSGSTQTTSGPPARTGTGVIRGRVTAADSGQPLREAWVRLVGLPPGIPGESQPIIATDEQGRYEFKDLPAGRFTVSAGTITSQYILLGYGQRTPSDPPRQLELANGETLDRIDFVLPKGGVLIAHVTDDLGDPISGVQVQIQTYRFVNGERRLSFIDAATTNDLGEAIARPMASGDYYVVAATASNPSIKPATLASNISRLVYAPTYYPGTRSSPDAQPVHVTSGQETRVSISLLPGRAARISGVIRTSDGATPVRPMVILRSSPLRVTVQPDGSFNITDVMPGEYSIDVRPSDATSSSQEVAQFPISVTGDDITNVVVTTSKTAGVRGHLTFEGGIPADASPSAYTLRVLGGVTSLIGAVGGGLTWNPDWTFELRGLWGPGVIRFSPETSWFLKSVTLDGRDVTDTPLTFGGRDLNGVELVVSQKRTELNGGVTDARGGNVKDFVVVAFPEDRTKWGSQSRFIASVRSDKVGRFKVLGLPPGRYFAAAVESLERGDEYDPALLARLQSGATRVTLLDAEAKTVNLRLMSQ